MGDSKTYKSRSPFGKHFQIELMNCKRLVGIFEMEEQNENTPKNNYYFPDLPSFLVTHYMPVCPLWSGLILGPSLYPGQCHVTSTNAIAENWMRIVKITILQKQCKLRPGDFIRKLREGIVGRIKAFEFAFNPLSLKVLKRHKTQQPKDDERIDEMWKKKKPRQTYFKPGKPMNSNKQVSLKKLKNLRHGKLSHLPSIMVASPQVNSKVVTLYSDLSNDDSIPDETLSIVDVKPYYHGEFKTVTPSWQREKCKEIRLTFTTGILYENEAADKSLEIRQLIPTKERRISPDGNCLFRSLSYIITGTDYNHKEIRELIIDKMKGEYRQLATNYVQARRDMLPEGRCSIEII